MEDLREHYRKMRFDSDRTADALRRVSSAIEVAEYHEKQAQVERNRAMVLIRTWNLCPESPVYPMDGKGLCCGNPENCTGRSH